MDVEKKIKEDSFKSLSFDFSTIKALLASTNRYRTLFENAGDSIFVLDIKGNIIDVNRLACQRLGYTRKELTGMIWKDIEPPEEAAKSKERFAKLKKEGRVIFETAHKRKDGGIIPIEASSRIIEYDDDLAILTIARDISERKQAEQEKARLQTQLRQAQKMEAIGTLAGGIAHDFNNILTPISGYTELAMRKIPAASKARQNLEQVLTAIRRAKSLVQQILTFSRQDGQKKCPLQIQSILKEALKLLRASFPSSVEIRPHIASTGTVVADPTQIHQVILNLCTNAHHAMKDGEGILEIVLADIELDSHQAKQGIGLKPGPYVKLSVSDTGHGIKKENLDRIFEPYFTTKAEGEGTGMGLSVVHGIVKSHGGDITVESKIGDGTTFHVFFPRAAIDEKELEKPKISTPIPRGRERILLVDDEQAITEVMEQLLEDLGYRVSSRNDPMVALESFRISPFLYDLVITDLTMPRLTGIKLAAEIHRIRKDIPIVIATGNRRHITARQAAEAGVKEFIIKPPAMEEIAVVVRRVLDERKRPGQVQRY